MINIPNVLCPILMQLLGLILRYCLLFLLAWLASISLIHVFATDFSKKQAHNIYSFVLWTNLFNRHSFQFFLFVRIIKAPASHSALVIFILDLRSLWCHTHQILIKFENLYGEILKSTTTMTSSMNWPCMCNEIKRKKCKRALKNIRSQQLAGISRR